MRGAQKLSLTCTAVKGTCPTGYEGHTCCEKALLIDMKQTTTRSANLKISFIATVFFNFLDLSFIFITQLTNHLQNIHQDQVAGKAEKIISADPASDKTPVFQPAG
jgi:hypothetical protein